MTKNNTKTATFKTFEAARLSAGKYAGIPKGIEKTFMPDPLKTYEAFETAKNYGSDARKFAALTVSQISASGLEYMGFFAVPAGLKAAARMARRVSGEYSGSRFSFGFDAAGRWSYEFDDPEGMASTDGSAEDVGADGVARFSSSMREIPAVVWALASFDVVQLWKNEKGFFFFAVGNVDDGRVLLLNSGMEGEFMDPSEMTEDRAEVVAAVANYPAAPVAACEAPKAENGKEMAQEGENSRGGAEVRPEAETAPEAKETAKESTPANLERVTGEWLTHAELMAHPEKCPKLGDVVEVRGGPVKGQEGFYFIDAWNSARYCGESFYGKGLNARKLDDVTKKRLYWPVRNGAGTAAAEEANRTEAKMRVIGPVSLAGLEYVRAELARVCDYDRSEEWVGKYTVELSLALARMEEENPALFKATRKAPEENGTGLKIAKNGLYVRESGKWELYRAFYSVDNRCDGRPCVTVYARSYGDLPKGFGLEIENDSDPYTDYVTGDRATVYEDHPLYKKFREAAAGAKHYHLTAEDVESVREYVENKLEAARMEREDEDAARAAKEEEKERHAREVIAEYVELFPGDAYHPHVVVEWSELGAMDDHGRTRGDATIFSVEAFEAITGDLDKYFEGDLGYNKLKFTFYTGNGFEFTDRCDLGDGGGSYGKRMRYVLGHARERASNGDIMLDGGAVVGLDEYEANARKYLENLAVTWDEIGAA